MKTSILSLLSFLLVAGSSANGQNPFYDDIEFTQITCNFNGSAAMRKTLLVYGDGGIIGSTDGGTSWERRPLSDSLNVIGMINVAGNFVGLCSEGYAISSSDGGNNWQKHFLGDFTNYQIQTDGANLYFLVSKKLLILNPALEKIKEYPIETDSLYNSFTLLGKSIVVSAGKAELVEINTENNQQRTISLVGLSGSATAKITTPIKSSGSNTVYFSIGTKVFRYDILADVGTTISSVQYTNGAVMETYNGNAYFLYLQRNSDKIDSMFFVRLTNNNPVTIKQPGNDRYIAGLQFRHLAFVSADTLVAVGNNNLIICRSTADENGN